MGTYTKQQLICMEPIPVCILAEVYPITRLPMKSKCSLGHSLNQFVVVGNHVLIFLLLLFLCFFFIIHAALIIESQIQHYLDKISWFSFVTYVCVRAFVANPFWHVVEIAVTLYCSLWKGALSCTMRSYVSFAIAISFSVIKSHL